MVRMYADYGFYINNYLNLEEGEEAPVKEGVFSSYAVKATKKIRHRTNGNICETEEIPEEVKMCCCELAERMQGYDAMKDDNGRILQGFSNDGNSGTFCVENLTEKSLEHGIDTIIREWLSNTGLLFCGVKKG